MKEYRQLPIEELSHLVEKEPEYFWQKPSQIEKEQEEYELTRRGFLDAVCNRIEVVYFAQSGHINALPNVRDQRGRVKVMLWLRKEDTPERQGVTLVHEMTHVDRNSWEKFEKINVFDEEEYYRVVDEEEDIVEDATQKFYEKNKSLVLLALNHVRLRRKELDL